MSKDYKFIGKNYIPPDVVGKVTGQAKYAEDFRADGMLFAKVLLSPMPHARVKRLDVRAAERMPGVVAVLTADDVPNVEMPQEPILTNRPRYIGDRIAAVAAVDEATAAAAIEAIELELEPLPFVLDPLDSLRPGGPDVHPEGNIYEPLRFEIDEFGTVGRIKWTPEDFEAAGEGRMPMGETHLDWSFGDLEAAFKQADLILDETFVTQSTSHHTQEPSSLMAYWRNGKLFVYLSTQSPITSIPDAAKVYDMDQEDIVFISEHVGGGFGGKSLVNPRIIHSGIPVFLSKKAGGRPVMLRVTRAEQYYFGRCRPAFQGRVKIGFRADGKITAIDLITIQNNGPYNGWPHYAKALEYTSLQYQPFAMRGRGMGVFTNTPPVAAQRGPGGNQIAPALEPFIDKAARELGLDRLAIRKLNGPTDDSKVGASQQPIAGSYMNEALDMGAEMFGWEEKKKLSGSRRGDKLVGVGIGARPGGGGISGFDGLVTIKPDGKLYIYSGEGNIGSYSYSDTARVAAEILKMPWEKCEVVWGRTDRGIPWTSKTAASFSAYSGTRNKYVAAKDALRKLQEIAAMDLGGSPDDYDVADARVFLKSNPSRGLSFADAAERAIELGGKYSGRELPDNLDPYTIRSTKAVAGTGLVGVARDDLQTGNVQAGPVAFAEVEVDTLTGKIAITDFVMVVDCGTVLHPMSLRTQVFGAAVWGFGFALTERHVYDSHSGWPATKELYTAKPLTYLDMPGQMDWAAVNKPDRSHPIGVKGIGEPPMGAAAAAIVCAISDALGGTTFNRTPVSLDMVLNALEKQEQSYGPLEVFV